MASSLPKEKGTEMSEKQHLPVHRSTPHTIISICMATAMIILPAIYSHISQLTLSPVYGSVPASSFHRPGIMIAALIGWVGMDRINTSNPRMPTDVLPVLAWTIPTIQYFLFQYSTQLGPVIGPLVTESCTLYPLVSLSAAAAVYCLKGIDLSHGSRLMANHGKFIGSYILFTSAIKVAGDHLPRYLGLGILMTRTGLQFVIATFYSIFLPSKWLLFAIPSLLFSASYNVHVPSGPTTARLNSNLQTENYVLLHRQDSLTGYISVLESKEPNFRVMRCDHSLLGGEWIPPPGAPKQRIRDPIYAVFTMLEAVRLIETGSRKPRNGGLGTNALVIGLGIGTTPAAFVAHGINTTVVEIDPAVYELATRYFGFPGEAIPKIEDAVNFVQRSRNAEPPQQYDFIVHDVFTGGVEPAELFTLEFMQGLHALLKDDGAIAINYAGDLNLPSAGLIVRTILAAFPSCRVFREGEPSGDTDVDFTNMVVFCKKTKSSLQFRKPTKADYLGSRSRESYMFPRHEIGKKAFEKNHSKIPEILVKEQIHHLHSWHSKSAVGHWKIMRTVLPASVWEQW
ncbi:hypothetical protein LOZ12_001240 [Ophidiomyces ophidiicola]|uniref:Uncharacterized protein n=1 Tax=Ophidiomyces ophidiicola TaxID=1387563 RepID=A0ACB8V301_9EURO|nr:uncharacterized protein LOZ57_004159 [Ophidiomyces ophidiicola]KAI1921310.1 hypothetical protein LOZ64_001592 [Ophidiomyces ophidiicola]KAI1945473.1 hypothetical protein LOZ57_004159 [Ophidiomyces ophidiicola]KAI1950253.1 hypothetical protein LOZ62_002000 [Ophidiomyces ophidiicola]KAI1972929.1 hypothetical protein LOZ56_002123 [Ophidiomyces ophidiicola]KAI2029477.1 hypothetical protein LOZ45_001835 [Ophidiomyces ophidiicola]